MSNRLRNGLPLSLPACLVLFLAVASGFPAAPPSCFPPVLCLWLPEEAQAQLIDPATFGFTVEAIEVLPSTTEAKVLVRRNLGFAVGDRVLPDVLIESNARLESTGSFRQVDVHTRRGEEPGAIVVVVEVEIGRRIHFEAGIGREDFSGWYLNILGLRWTSPLRRGGTARIGLHSGLENSGLFATFEVPDLPRSGLDGLLDLASYERTWYANDGRDEFRQSLSLSRFLLGARKQTRDGFSTTLWVGAATTHPADSVTTTIGDEEVDLPATVILPEPGHSTFLETRLLFQRNRLASVDPWRKGTLFGAQLRFADEVGEGGFWSVEGDARLFLPAFERSALALRLQAGYTGPGTPYHQRFRLGGPRHLRGYTSARLSGPLGAQAVWIGSAEWRHALLGSDRPQPRVVGTVFFDVGNHWDANGAHGSVAAGVGYGLQIQIPWVQVVNWEVSFPITDESPVDSVVGALSLGRSF